jgi:hypothetical protein
VLQLLLLINSPFLFVPLRETASSVVCLPSHHRYCVPDREDVGKGTPKPPSLHADG